MEKHQILESEIQVKVLEWAIFFLMNGVTFYPLGTMTLLRADCLTPFQIWVRSESRVGVSDDLDKIDDLMTPNDAKMM